MIVFGRLRLVVLHLISVFAVRKPQLKKRKGTMVVLFGGSSDGQGPLVA